MNIEADALQVLLARGIGYVITDRDLCIVEARGLGDSAAAQPSSWVGKSLFDLAPELFGSEDALAELLAGELPRYQIPWVNRDLPDGRLAYFTLVTLPRRDETGAVRGLIHALQDVTDMGAFEQQLMQQRNALRLLEQTLREQNTQLAAVNTELRRLDQAKSAFVSIAAHELRTPLASISGYIEMLLDGDAGPLTPHQTDYLRVVDGSAQRLLRITRDLLDAARLEAGRMELILVPASLAAIIEEVIAELRPQLAAREQRIELSAEADLPLALIDPLRAGQIVRNLIGNASKFCPARSIIRAQLARSEGEPGWLRLAISDEGPGIAPEDRERLFRPFERGGDSMARAGAGAGLGLYIAKSLAELHGGRIWLESNDGRGVAFFVTFPAVEETA